MGRKLPRESCLELRLGRQCVGTVMVKTSEILNWSTRCEEGEKIDLIFEMLPSSRKGTVTLHRVTSKSGEFFGYITGKVCYLEQPPSSK